MIESRYSDPAHSEGLHVLSASLGGELSGGLPLRSRGSRAPSRSMKRSSRATPLSLIARGEADLVPGEHRGEEVTVSHLHG